VLDALGLAAHAPEALPQYVHVTGLTVIDDMLLAMNLVGLQLQMFGSAVFPMALVPLRLFGKDRFICRKFCALPKSPKCFDRISPFGPLASRMSTLASHGMFGAPKRSV